jgi:hypothetical protein
VPACGSRRATSHGLELVVLNGCDSLELGKMCREAGVPVVVCWATELQDEAAYLFARGFFGALGQDGRAPDGYARAFEAGKEAILKKRRRVLRADGAVEEEVPYFEIADPRQARELPTARPTAELPKAAGIPQLLQPCGSYFATQAGEVLRLGRRAEGAAGQ